MTAAEHAPNLKMVRKKIDNRIRVLIENNVKTRMRSFFVVVGDKAKDQVSHSTQISIVCPVIQSRTGLHLKADILLSAFLVIQLAIYI